MGRLPDAADAARAYGRPIADSTRKGTAVTYDRRGCSPSAPLPRTDRRARGTRAPMEVCLRLHTDNRTFAALDPMLRERMLDTSRASSRRSGRGSGLTSPTSSESAPPVSRGGLS
jgi:hypothetical protein